MNEKRLALAVEVNTIISDAIARGLSGEQGNNAMVAAIEALDGVESASIVGATMTVRLSAPVKVFDFTFHYPGPLSDLTDQREEGG